MPKQFDKKIESFLKCAGFKDTTLREFDIIEGEQESWVVNESFILTYMVKDNAYLIEKIIPIPGTYLDPPCEDYEQIGESINSFDSLMKAYMNALTEYVLSDIAMVEWEEKYLND